MPEITQLRFAQLLRRTFGLKGAGDPGRAVAGAISCSYDIGDNYHPEDRALRGEKTFGVWGSTTNNVGAFGFLEAINPLGSGKIAVLKRLTWGFLIPTAANQPGICALSIASPIDAAGAAPNNPGFPKDGRFPATVGGRAIAGLAPASGGAASPLGVYVVQFFPGAATAPFLHQADNLDLVLPPGVMVVIRAASDTLPVAAWNWGVLIEGYERILDPNELLLPA